MSASRDQSQKIAFVYSNLYQIYQNGKGGNTAVIKKTNPNISSPILGGPIQDPAEKTEVTEKVVIAKKADLKAVLGLAVDAKKIEEAQSGKVLKAKQILELL